jgi:hypothetical protein
VSVHVGLIGFLRRGALLPDIVFGRVRLGPAGFARGACPHGPSLTESIERDRTWSCVRP